MEDTIRHKLAELEQLHGFEVILAVESGSRGWGFASEDADYDVRFVFKYPVDRYLSIRKPRDCINLMDGDLDFEGYDIYKFYDLLLKSNMNIIDWLMQDVIYIDKIIDKPSLQTTVRECFDRRTYIVHNIGLAKGKH